MLDDFGRGDVVCVACGLVIDSPPMSCGDGGSGGGGGLGTTAPGRFRLRRPDELWTPVSQHGLGAGDRVVDDGDGGSGGSGGGVNEDDRDAGSRRKVSEVLELFHLNNQHVRERTLEDYKAVYRDRPARRGFRKSEAKDRLALAFAVCRQLNRLGAPRPPAQVAAACGVEDPGSLLRVGKLLNMSREEIRSGLGDLPDALPEDYVDLLCANLHLPRRLGCLARSLMQTARVRWLMYGRNPGHIAGGTLHSALVKLGESRPEELAARIAEALDCQPACILSISSSLPAYEVTVCDNNGRPHAYEDLLLSIGVWSLSCRTPMSCTFRARTLE